MAPKISFRLLAVVTAACLILGCSDDSSDLTDDTGVPSDVGSSHSDMQTASDMTVSSDSEADQNEETVDTGSRDASQSLDQDGMSVDMDTEDLSTSDAGLDDMGTDDSDMAPDTGNDMSSDPYEGRPVGQCAVSSDCPENPNGKFCNRLLPGGSCGNCGTDVACEDECRVGTCVTTCSTTDDCPPGLRCSSSLCRAQSCTNGVCPVPFFGCSSSDLCTRIDCSQDASVCPSGTSCLSGLCIEDRFLNR